jgi:hypothetical protein
VPKSAPGASSALVTPLSSLGPSPLGPLAGAPAPSGPECRSVSQAAASDLTLSLRSLGPSPLGPLAGAPAPRGPEGPAALEVGPRSPGYPLGASTPRGPVSRCPAQVPAFPGSLAGAPAPRGPVSRAASALGTSLGSPHSSQVPVPSGSLAGAPAPSGPECCSAPGFRPGSSGSGAVSQAGSETRAEILATFPPVPDHLLVLCEALTLAAGPTESRAHRAWVAGCWARAVLDSRVRTPNRTPPIQLAPRVYVVLRASGVRCPAIFRSRRDYFAALGSLEGSDSVSHAWPSEAEARVYLEAAGFHHLQ